MNGAHLHLMVIHFPIAGAFLSFFALVAAGLLKSDSLKAGAFGLVVLAGLAAWAADETGGKAFRVVKDKPGFDRTYVRPHAQAAEWAERSLGLAAVLAVVGLVLYRKQGKVPGWSYFSLLVVTLWACTIVARVNYLGGQIGHPETRPGWDAEAPAMAATPQPGTPMEKPAPAKDGKAKAAGAK